MRNIRKLQSMEETKRNCGNCYDYSSPANYWQSFFAKKETQQTIRG